jgi:hypothetical protein
VSDREDEEVKKPFRVQRRRLGAIKFFHEEGKYGFIAAEDFRDDVFFHIRDWDGNVEQPGDNPPRVLEPAPEMWVEFELDDEHFATEKKLRAKQVRPTDRPEGKKLSGKDATFRITSHHPNARRKRPSWRQ